MPPSIVFVRGTGRCGSKALVDAMSKREVRDYLRAHNLLGNSGREEMRCAS